MATFRYKVTVHHIDNGWERYQWCNINLSNFKYIVGTGSGMHEYHFRYKADAVMFRLIWG